MKKSLIATGAASLALAAMPMVGVFADDNSVVDTIQVTVADACTVTEGSTTDGLDNKDTTYADTVANGAETTFATTTSAGVHTFHVLCNDKDGWSLTATPTNLTGYVAANDSTTNGDTINFVASGSYAASGAAGKWTATIASEDLAANSITQPSTAGSSNTITTQTGNQAGGVEITSTYKAFVGTETSAGFYQGTITYNLNAL